MTFLYDDGCILAFAYQLHAAAPGLFLPVAALISCERLSREKVSLSDMSSPAPYRSRSREVTLIGDGTPIFYADPARIIYLYERETTGVYLSVLCLRDESDTVDIKWFCLIDAE